MPLPQQVVDRLSQEPTRTPGWSAGLIAFSGAILFIMAAIYIGLTVGYEPYLDAHIAQLNKNLASVGNQISPDDLAKVSTFYSQVKNLKSAIANHVTFTRFLSWLEKNTEANVYFSNMDFSSGNQITFSGYAKSEADVDQQLAIWEKAPEVKKAAVTSIVFSDATNLWQFNGAITVDPAALLRPQVP